MMIGALPRLATAALLAGSVEAAAEPAPFVPPLLAKPIATKPIATKPIAKPAPKPAAALVIAPVPPTFAVVQKPVLALLSFKLLARQEAEAAQVPSDLVEAVMKIESDFDPTRIGGVGEIGLMQVRPTTAAMLGFRGDDATLAIPAVNIHYGASYLGGAWRSANGNVCRALMKYRAGQGEEAMSPLSVRYCTRAKAYLTAIASPLADKITPLDLIATIGAPPTASVAKLAALDVAPAKGLRGLPSKKYWAVFEARIKRINARIEVRWRRVATR